MSNKIDFDDYTDNYNELIAKDTQFFSTNEDYFSRYKVQIVGQNTTSRVTRILEYGCGIGRNIKHLSELFPRAEIVGSDISERSLELAGQLNPDVQFVCEKEPLDSLGQFDLIFVAGVFHHVPVEQWHEVASTLRNRLKPGGSLFVFEHNPYNPITRHIVSKCPFDEDAVLLKPSELRTTLTGAKLLSQKTRYCLFIPPKFKKFVGLEKYLGHLPLGGQYWVKASRDT